LFCEDAAFHVLRNLLLPKIRHKVDLCGHE